MINNYNIFHRFNQRQVKTMKSFTFLSVCFALCALLISSKAEAKTHISIGFGPSIVEHHYVQPCYVEECYPYERRVIERTPYGKRVFVESRPVYRELYRPVYRERVVVQPRPFFPEIRMCCKAIIAIICLPHD